MKKTSSRIMQKAAETFNRIPTWILIMLFALLPALFTFLLVRIRIDSTINQFVPVTDVDQIIYWHEILTFQQAGFNGGYYTILENPAPLGIFHFDAHGPIFIVTYGLVSKLVGWSYSTGIYLNMGILGLAFAVFARKSKLDRIQIVLAGIALITCWPVIFYLPSIYQEAFQQSLAILLALFFYLAISQQHRMTTAAKVGIVGFLIFASLTRISWSLLFIPLLMLMFRKQLRQQTTAVILALILMLGVQWVSAQFNAQGASFITFILLGFKEGFWQGIQAMLFTLRDNVSRFYYEDLGELTLPVRIFHLNIAAVIAATIAELAMNIKRKNKLLPESDGVSKRVAVNAFTLFNLLSIVGIAFAIYLYNGNFRLFAPHLLLSLLLLIAAKQYKPAFISMVVSVIFLPFLLNAYGTYWRPNYFTKSDVLAQIKFEMELNIAYQPEQENPWCNTIFMPASFFGYPVSQIPAGIGVSHYINRDWNFPLFEQPTLPLKSKYVMLDNATYGELAGYIPLNLQEMDVFSFGTLYLNLDADCP